MHTHRRAQRCFGPNVPIGVFKEENSVPVIFALLFWFWKVGGTRVFLTHTHTVRALLAF